MSPTRPRIACLASLIGVLALVAIATPVASAAGSSTSRAVRAPARSPGASGQSPGTSAHSPYPGGASRPTLRPGAGELLRAHSATTGKPKKKPVLHGDPARALVSFEAMQKAYYIKGSGLYNGEPFSYLWAFSQAFAATVSMAYIPHLGVNLSAELHARLTGLDNYLDTDNSGAPEGTYTSTLAAFDGTVAPPGGPGGTKYYDDNDWVGLELVRLYQLTHAAALLGSAEGIMAFEMAGWQENATLGCPGGLPFSNLAENNERNTVTTAPAAELGTELYQAQSQSVISDVKFGRRPFLFYVRRPCVDYELDHWPESLDAL